MVSMTYCWCQKERGERTYGLPGSVSSQYQVWLMLTVLVSTLKVARVLVLYLPIVGDWNSKPAHVSVRISSRGCAPSGVTLVMQLASYPVAGFVTRKLMLRCSMELMLSPVWSE